MAAQADAVASANPFNLEFYTVDTTSLKDSARKLLHEYSGIPEDSINSHVEAIVCSLWICSAFLRSNLVTEKARFRGREKILIFLHVSGTNVASGRILALECFDSLISAS